MGRIKFLLALAVVALTSTSLAFAGVPDAGLSNAPNVLITPDGSLEYIVYVANASGPIDTAQVSLIFSVEAAGLVCWCTGQTQPLIQGVTDVAGEASFFISGGGCLNPDSTVSIPVVQVIANGVLLDEVGVVSPDIVDNGGKLPTQGWNPGGLCEAGLGDLVSHTGPLASGAYSFCSDFDSNGVIDLGDAVLVTPALATGATCTQAP